MGLALGDGLGASVVFPIWAGAGGALLVPSDRGDRLGGLGGPRLWTGRLLQGEFGRRCARGRDEGGLGWKGGRGHGTGLLLLGGLDLGILFCGAVGVIGRGGWLSRIGRLAASELLDKVFDRLSLWIVEGCEGSRGPGLFAGARGGCGLLLYGDWVGRQGIEGGDELEHGLARGRRGLGLGWRGQLPGGLLDIGVREIGLGWRLEGGGLGIGVAWSGCGAVDRVSKEGIKVVPGGHGEMNERGRRKGRRLVCGARQGDSPGHELLEEDLSLGFAGVGVRGLGGGRGGDLLGEGRGGGVEEGEECALPVCGGGRGRVAGWHCGCCGSRVVGHRRW